MLAIPTAKRESENYLLQTLKSLIESMNEKEKEDSLIIVYVAEVCNKFIAFSFKSLISSKIRSLLLYPFVC